MDDSSRAAGPGKRANVAMFAFWLLVGATSYADSIDASAAFEDASQLYERGQYAAAAAAYQKLLGSGIVSASTYFNCGNALFKAGEVGHAIISYRLAEQLAPRDPDVQANLRYIRGLVDDPNAQPGFWRRALLILSLDELALLFTTAYWTWGTLLTLATVRGSPQRLPFTFASGWLTLGFGAWLLTSVFLRDFRPAVVVVPEAVVRYGPLEESQSHFTLHDGAELTLLGTKNDWSHVQDGRARTGWVRSDRLASAVHDSFLSSLSDR